MRTSTPLVPLLLGTLVVGTLDAVYAMAYWGIGYGTPPIRIFHSVAAGLLGRASHQGGMATAWLGAGLHYFIAGGIVVVYYLASARWPTLVEKPIRYGLAYGLAVYAVMNHVVVPLSAAETAALNLPWVATTIIVHALFVGVPSAIFSRRARLASH